MPCRLAFTLLLVFHFTAGSANAQTSKPDTSPHKVQFVTVDKNVRLEVLDWGGTGRPLLFLPGGGGTAHSFDTLATKFTAHHHVYGMTRRGAGASSAPPPLSGVYSADRLGEDVLAVIAALKLERPVLAGWSLAGSELSTIGSQNPEKVSGLIYLDAAYSYAYYNPRGDLLIDANELQNSLDTLISMNGPELLGPIDPTQKARIQELLHTNLPRLEKDLQNWQKMEQTLPTLPQTPNAPINSAILRGAQRNGPIKSPILAIFALPHLWPMPADPKAQAAMKAEDIAWDSEAADAFQAGNPSARVVRLANADHELWATNEVDVEREMNAFMDGLVK